MLLDIGPPPAIPTGRLVEKEIRGAAVGESYFRCGCFSNSGFGVGPRQLLDLIR